MTHARRAVLMLIAGFAVLIAAFWALGLLIEPALPEGSEHFDARWTRAASSEVASRAWLRSLLAAITQAGGGPVTIPIAVGSAIAWFGLRRERRLPAALAVSIAGSTAVKSVVKALVDRPRPPVDRLVEATGSSFPSGHAVRAVALYGVLALMVGAVARSPGARRTAWTLAGVLIVAVAGSRVALGVHYIVDVIAGILLGAAWVAVVASALLTPALTPTSRSTG